jgi:hypothetical protein
MYSCFVEGEMACGGFIFGALEKNDKIVLKDCQSNVLLLPLLTVD